MTNAYVFVCKVSKKEDPEESDYAQCYARCARIDQDSNDPRTIGKVYLTGNPQVDGNDIEGMVKQCMDDDDCRTVVLSLVCIGESTPEFQARLKTGNKVKKDKVSTSIESTDKEVRSKAGGGYVVIDNGAGQLAAQNVRQSEVILDAWTDQQKTLRASQEVILALTKRTIALEGELAQAKANGMQIAVKDAVEASVPVVIQAVQAYENDSARKHSRSMEAKDSRILSLEREITLLREFMAAGKPPPEAAETKETGPDRSAWINPALEADPDEGWITLKAIDELLSFSDKVHVNVARAHILQVLMTRLGGMRMLRLQALVDKLMKEEVK